jgi:hypothetical protein
VSCSEHWLSASNSLHTPPLVTQRPPSPSCIQCVACYLGSRLFDLGFTLYSLPSRHNNTPFPIAYASAACGHIVLNRITASTQSPRSGGRCCNGRQRGPPHVGSGSLARSLHAQIHKRLRVVRLLVALGDHRLHLPVPKLGPVRRALERVVVVSARLPRCAPALDVALVEQREIERLQDDGPEEDAENDEVGGEPFAVVRRLVGSTTAVSWNVGEVPRRKVTCKAVGPRCSRP